MFGLYRIDDLILPNSLTPPWIPFG